MRVGLASHGVGHGVDVHQELMKLIAPVRKAAPQQYLTTQIRRNKRDALLVYHSLPCSSAQSCASQTKLLFTFVGRKLQESSVTTNLSSGLTVRQPHHLPIETCTSPKPPNPKKTLGRAMWRVCVVAVHGAEKRIYLGPAQDFVILRVARPIFGQLPWRMQGIAQIKGLSFSDFRRNLQPTTTSYLY